MKRTFISINPGKETIEKIGETQSIVKREVFKICGEYAHHIKWELHNKFHLTLFFIGDTDHSLVEHTENSLKESVSAFDFEKAELKLRGIGGFPNLKYPRVIFMDLENSDGHLSFIADKIKNVISAAGATDKPFHPHITLGRVKRDRKLNLKSLENLKFADHLFEVNSLYFMESRLMRTGSEYSVLSEYKFGKIKGH